MNVVLILNRQGAKDLRVMVKLHTKNLRNRVIGLLEDNKGMEAFNLMIKEAEVENYLAPGERPLIKPAMVMVEDLL